MARIRKVVAMGVLVASALVAALVVHSDPPPPDPGTDGGGGEPQPDTGDMHVTILDGASHGDSEYYVVTGGNWFQCEAFATTIGGHLVTINDEEENAWIAEHFANHSELFIGKYIPGGGDEGGGGDGIHDGGGGGAGDGGGPGDGGGGDGIHDGGGDSGRVDRNEQTVDGLPLLMCRPDTSHGFEYTIGLEEAYLWVSGDMSTYNNWITEPDQMHRYGAMKLGDLLEPETNGMWITVSSTRFVEALIEVPSSFPFKPSWASTAAGLNVLVEPETNSGDPAPVTLTFPYVDASGTTSVLSQSVGPDAPGNFTVLGTFFQLVTNATFHTAPNEEDPEDHSGQILLTFTYELPEGYLDEDVSVGHFENGAWTVIALGGSIDIATGQHFISGYVNSLSPFALFRPTNQRPVANAGPDATYEAASATATSVSLDGSGSTEPDGEAVTYAWSGDFGTATGANPTVSLGIGVHTVTLTVTDPLGAHDSDTVVITVSDTTAPTFTSLAASPDSLWPPNHQMVAVTLTGAGTDACDAAPGFSILSVASNEPQNAQGDGDTDHDWEVTGAMTLNLRAERAGGGNGRIYTITVACTDASGNHSNRSVEVKVPKSKKK